MQVYISNYFIDMYTDKKKINLTFLFERKQRLCPAVLYLVEVYVIVSYFISVSLQVAPQMCRALLDFVWGLRYHADQ